MNKCDHDCDQALIKRSWGSVYRSVSSCFWLPRGKFVKVKWVKIPSTAGVQVAKYMRTVK